MTFRFHIILCIISLTIICLASALQAEVNSHFSADDTSYSYSVNIRSALPCLEISKLLYSPEAVRHFSDFADSIKFIFIDSSSHIAEMHFKKWLYSGFSRYKRVLHSIDSLTIDLEKFEHNWTAIPQLKKAVIRYYFEENGKGCTISYQQRIIVNKKTGWVYRRMVRWQLDHFAEKLSEYVLTESK